MKVLFLQHLLGYGGATKSLLLMQKALKHYVEIYTIVPQSKDKKQKVIIDEFKDSLNVTEMYIPTIYSYSERTISHAEFEKRKNFFPSKLIEYINKIGIDILHVNSTLFSHILEAIKHNTSCKIVVHLREMLPYGSKHPIDHFIIEKYSEFADAIISISNNELQHFNKSKKTYIISNPHDFEQTDILLGKNKKVQQQIVVGMCSNLVRIKGHLIFLEAAKILQNNISQNISNIEFRIIGYPNTKFSIKNLIVKLIHYGYKSEFDRAVKKAKLKNLNIIPYSFNIFNDLAALDIYIRPDLSGHPWGRDVIEAMTLKKPVIATGKSEFYIKNGVSGYLVDPNNPEVIAEKVKILIENPKIREKMGEAGYKVVRTMCDISYYRKKIMDIYHTILNQ